jgi:hypothetical protein
MIITNAHFVKRLVIDKGSMVEIDSINKVITGSCKAKQLKEQFDYLKAYWNTNKVEQ